MQQLNKKQFNHNSAHIRTYTLKHGRRVYGVEVLQSYACDVILNVDGVIIPLTHHAYGATTSKHCAKYSNIYSDERRERVKQLKRFKAYRILCEAIKAGGYIPRDNVERANDDDIIKVYNVAKKLNF